MNLKDQVTTTLADYEFDYDVDAIVKELQDFGLGMNDNLDSVDDDAYWMIVERHSLDSESV